MGDAAIQVTGLGKRYRLGEAPATSIQAALTRRVRSLCSAFGEDDGKRDFWALRDLSFEIPKGQVVGIIGRNGAGKSTLLKLLSRITPPTTGRTVINGRVSSLLEVGTGFHPELSGRDNIFLNGAILGMRRSEIRAKFDEIVEFSEVERFLDTPVKHYSSGMYVRLAFAVAAHLDPEILIIDEVLAVGDAQFQQKCLGKINDLTGGGERTVLFVSHNTASILSLCSRCLLLRGGRLVADDTPQAVISTYLESNQNPLAPVDPTRTCITELRLAHQPETDRLVVETTVYSPVAQSVALELIILDHLQQPVVFCERGTIFREQRLDLQPGATALRLVVESRSLAKGRYMARLQVVSPSAGQIASVESEHPLSLSQNPVAGQQNFFDQQWGLGSISLPMRIERR